MSFCVSDSPSAPAVLSPLEHLWLCEAIRLREAQGQRLDDREANRHARTAGGDLEQRIQARALWLARRDGLLEALAHYRHGARLALLVLGLLALLSGAGLALAALGDGQRPVNLFWALGSLLGLNWLLLAGWLLSWAFANSDSATLGQAWRWLSLRCAGDARASQLAAALPNLLQPRHLSRWGLGLLSHGLWLLTLSAALLMLLALLSTRRYGFVWETTLLASEHFVSLTHSLGALPALLGFSQPDSALIRASGNLALSQESARQAWAGWLLGVFVVFGLLPRLLLALLCFGAWRHGLRRLRLDLQQPAYQLLRHDLQPDSQRLDIGDLAPPLPAQHAITSQVQSSSGALLLAIELDHQQPWPPHLPAGVADGGVLDSREQRQQLLERLSHTPPTRLAIACDPRRSPDRGTLALLGELARSAASTRIWLLPAPPGQTLDSQRLGDWQRALQQLQLNYSDSAPLHWLESGHD